MSNNYFIHYGVHLEGEAKVCYENKNYRAAQLSGSALVMYFQGRGGGANALTSIYTKWNLRIMPGFRLYSI